MSPQLYQKLYDRYKGAPVPMADRLANVLHRDFELLETVAPAAAQAFIESARFVGLVTAANNIAPKLPTGGEPPAAAPSAPLPEPKIDVPPPTAAAPSVERAGMQAVWVPSDYLIYKCKIGKGRVLDIPLPREFTKADVKRLTAFLDTQVDDEPEPVAAATEK